MSPPFEVRYLPTAEKDLNEIFDYVLKDNPGAVAALLDKFDILSLSYPIIRKWASFPVMIA